MNLIDLWEQIVKEKSNAPLISIRVVGYWLISSTLGQLVDIPAARPLKPNIYVAIASPPAIGRKSTLIFFAKEVIRRFYGEVEYKKRIFEYGSVEGIVDRLNESKVSWAIFISDELGSLLAEVRKKDWQAGLSGLLNKLYYGEDFIQYFSRRAGKVASTRIVSGIYATLLGAMQETEVFIDVDMVKRGFVRRLIIVSPKKEDFIERGYKPILSEPEFFDSKFDKLVELLKKRFEELRDVRYVLFMPKVKDLINNLDLDFWKKGVNALGKEIAEKYLASETEKLLKLSVLEALADTQNSPQDFKDLKIINVKEVHFNKAYKFFKKYLEGYLEVIDKALSPTVPARIVSYASIEDKVKAIISRNGGLIPYRRLLQLSNMESAELKKLLIEMAEKETISIVKARLPGHRRFGIYIAIDKGKAKNFINSVLRARGIAEIVDVKDLRKEWLFVSVSS